MDSKNQKNPAAENQTAPTAQAEYLRGLAEILRAENLSELEVEAEGMRITLKAPEPPATVASGAFLPSVVAQPLPVAVAPGAGVAPTTAPATPAAGEENLLEIVSPMIGVFYRAPSPAEPNFVEIGDHVEIGQTVALVEAMKVFSEITAEVAGTVVEIKAESADLVETGQVLMTIRP